MRYDNQPADCGNGAGAPCETLLRLPEVLSRVGLGKTQVYKLIARAEFPAPIRLTDRAVAWPESEVQAWIAERIENARRAER